MKIIITEDQFKTLLESTDNSNVVENIFLIQSIIDSSDLLNDGTILGYDVNYNIDDEYYLITLFYKKTFTGIWGDIKRQETNIIENDLYTYLPHLNFEVVQENK